MSNMKCPNQSHNGQQIILVCMDKQCKNTKLCCWQCIGQFHNTHHEKCVQIDQISAFIQQESNKQVNYPQSCSYGQQQIIQSLERLSVLINSLQKIIIEKIELIKHQNLQDYLKQIKSNQQGIEYWNQILEDIFQYLEVDNYNIVLTKIKEGQLNEIEERSIQIIKQSEQSLQLILNQIDSISVGNASSIQCLNDNQKQMKIPKFCFKENRMNTDISIIDECILQSNNILEYLIENNVDSYAMAFANEGFDPNNQSYEFAFIIKNQIANVWVGVGNDDGGNIPSYLFANYAQLGHGQYMVSYHNFTFHHTDADINHKRGQGLNFKLGDKIQIKYDHATKVLEFRKQSEEAVVKMKITDMTKKLYPCAFLQPNDSVQLVEY